ncbi:hypothetical protein C1H46_023648 [Malus baccata]|uniref:t-SNARE coiled-coil homology domain-containing protein n=1 Tax=Malus baccata TaxID=106549 RepID=A0A540LWL0_MALBA|nr:hypothetical protein C1H46_023648 [Malus baccata]
MNDLMTKSFLSYVELKKQAQKDLEADLDVEAGAGKLNPSDQENLSQFFQEVGAIKADMEEITNLLHDLQSLNAEAKSTHSAKILRGLRDRMESDMVAVLRKARIVKARLEALDQSNATNRKMSDAYKEGSTVDRTRMSITGGLRVKLRDLMDNFQSLREKIVSDHKEDLKRRYYSATGDLPSDDMIEKIISGSLKVELFEGKTELDIGNKVRHEAVMDIQRSLTKLHQVFLDMAVLVEAQGEDIENIEDNVVLCALICLCRNILYSGHNIDVDIHVRMLVSGDGTLLSCGSNVYGQLGREKQDLGLFTVDISFHPMSLASGLGHSLAICQVTWGWNQSSQLGRGGSENIPLVVEGLEGEIPVSVSGGRVHSIALTSKGEVWDWGCGKNGRLGLGSSYDEAEPILLDSVEGCQVLQAVSGFDHNLVLVAE